MMRSMHGSYSRVIYFGAWYDNEWGYSNRCVDLALFIGNKLRQSNPQKVPAKA